MKNLTELESPTLLLDLEKTKQNIQRMQRKIEPMGVSLRPHLKTCKSMDVARLVAEPGDDTPITVSTVTEAEYFFDGGYRDILYAVSIVPNKLRRLKALQDKGANIVLITSDLEGAKTTEAVCQELQCSFPCLIEIDCDGKRAGLKPTDPKIIDLAQLLTQMKGLSFAGVMTHGGGSYAAKSIEELKDFAEIERSAVVTAATQIRSAGIDCSIVSMGSTPSITFAENLEGITEVRVGVFVFQDMVMEALNVCEVSDIAVSVLATVISHNRSENRVLIDAGSLALSADPGKPNRHGNVHFGLVCDGKTGVPFPDLFVTSCNQEHGLISLDFTSVSFDDLPIGHQLRILPNHACITAAAYPGYHVLGSDQKIVDYWTRCNGW
ncbi:alanine racemase [Sneathiella limimaris]|uniref:alanine racemase n=1 Tax=Sneathiella limimaris TaxID=1964213 RepID=UPI00146F0F1C|nr:alanine racemase [Sneathiella limimaris]